MMRHFDWFNFWLMGEEDPDPVKAEQYKRWRELQRLQAENEKKACESRGSAGESQLELARR
jgi:hypothetical protein